jgi:hypothetical protein
VARGGLSAAAQPDSACRLAAAAGRPESCPGKPCPFWKEGHGAPGIRCVIEELALERTLDLTRRRDLADWLLELRGQLAQ